MTFTPFQNVVEPALPTVQIKGTDVDVVTPHPDTLIQFGVVVHRARSVRDVLRPQIVFMLAQR